MDALIADEDPDVGHNDTENRWWSAGVSGSSVTRKKASKQTMNLVSDPDAGLVEALTNK